MPQHPFCYKRVFSMNQLPARATPTVHLCSPPYSFLEELIPRILAWETENSAREPLIRLCWQMRKQGATHFTEEVLEEEGEVAEERKEIEERIGAPYLKQFSARRFAFFRAPGCATKVFDDLVVATRLLLGYAIIVEMRLTEPVVEGLGAEQSYVLEAVTRPPTITTATGESLPHPQYFINCTNDFKVAIGTRAQWAQTTFDLAGVFFAQQNMVTTVCAHAALRSAVNSHRIFGQTKLTNTKINQILKAGGFTSPGAMQPVSVAGIAKVCEGLGIRAQPVKPEGGLHPDRILYPAIESGFPALVFFAAEPAEKEGVPPAAHVLTIHGHSINVDQWLPRARFVSGGVGGGSAGQGYCFSPPIWVDHFIGADDNIGAYLSIDCDALDRFSLPSANAPTRPDETKPSSPNAGVLLMQLPEIKVQGHEVQELVESNSQEHSGSANWIEHLFDFKISRGGLTRWFSKESARSSFRTLLVRRGEYLEHLRPGLQSAPDQLALAEAHLPELFWLVEVSITELHTGSRVKLGDLAFDASGGSGTKDGPKGGYPSSTRVEDELAFGWFLGVAKVKGGETRPWPITGPIGLFGANGQLAW